MGLALHSLVSAMTDWAHHLKSNTSGPLLPIIRIIQLSDLKPTLPTPFKPVVSGLQLSDLSIIQPNCYTLRMSDNRGSHGKNTQNMCQFCIRRR